MRQKENTPENPASPQTAAQNLPNAPVLEAPIIEYPQTTLDQKSEVTCCQMFFLCRPPQLDRCKICAGVMTLISCGACLSCMPFCGCYSCKRPNLWHYFWAGISCFFVVLWGQIVGIVLGIKMIRLA